MNCTTENIRQRWRTKAVCFVFTFFGLPLKRQGQSVFFTGSRRIERYRKGPINVFQAYIGDLTDDVKERMSF